MESYLLDQYFEETAPEKYRFLDYYQYRKSQKDFTNNFRLEAQRLRKCLEHLVECGSTPEKCTAAQHLLNVFKASIFSFNLIICRWTTGRQYGGPC